MSNKQTTPADVKIGAKIKLARTMKGWSQEKLAEHLGITFQQVQKYERGVNRISASRLMEVAEALGQSILWFHGISDVGPGGMPFSDLDPTLMAAAAQVHPDYRRAATDYLKRLSRA